MPAFLRALQRGRWRPAADVFGLRADALLDLRTRRDTLSVWLVADSESNLPDIVAALAAQRQHLQELDFVLLPEPAVQDLGIQAVATPGDTAVASARDLHRDLTGLTVGNIVDLARLIHLSGQPRRASKLEVRTILAGAITSGALSLDGLPPSLRASLERPLR